MESDSRQNRRPFQPSTRVRLSSNCLSRQHVNATGGSAAPTPHADRELTSIRNHEATCNHDGLSRRRHSSLGLRRREKDDSDDLDTPDEDRSPALKKWSP